MLSPALTNICLNVPMLLAVELPEQLAASSSGEELLAQDRGVRYRLKLVKLDLALSCGLHNGNIRNVWAPPPF